MTNFVELRDSLEAGTIRASDVEGWCRCDCGAKYWDDKEYKSQWIENGVTTEFVRAEVRCTSCNTRLSVPVLRDNCPTPAIRL